MQTPQNNSISILGSGSWGNTLAFLLGQNLNIVLWDHNASRVRIANRTRRFKKPITHKYPDSVYITDKLEDVLQSRIIINAVSLKGMYEVFRALAALGASENHILVNASKGIDVYSLKTPSEIIQEFLPRVSQAVISGPNLAKELILGKPMVTEVAAFDLEIAKIIQETISNPSLRVYTGTDVKGVELCAALKNVMAIAAGASDALKLGVSAKASLITRALHEIGKVLKVYNCQPETLLSPAGVGDLVATCSSELSRNYRVGFSLAEGKKLENIIHKLGEVAEGVSTTQAAVKIAREHDLDLPIVFAIKEVLNGECSGVDAVLTLMKRPVK